MDASSWDPAACSAWILRLELRGKEAIARAVVAEEIDGDTLFNLDRLSEVKTMLGISAGKANVVWKAIKELEREQDHDGGRGPTVPSSVAVRAPLTARSQQFDSRSRLRTYSGPPRHVQDAEADVWSCWGLCSRSHQVHAFDTDAAETSRDTDAVDCPQFRLIKLASWMLAPTWAPLAFGTVAVSVGCSVVLMSVWYEGLTADECPSGCDDEKKLLQWIFTGCMTTSALLVANVMHSFRDALMEDPPGALATLGWENPDRRTGRVKISEEDCKWLNITGMWWSALAGIAVPTLVASPWRHLMEDQFIWPERHDWMARSYFYWIGVHMFFLYLSILTFAIMLSLHEAAVLTRDAVLEVLRKLKDIDADGDEWVEVEADILSLASHTMPCVSDGYGQIVVVTFAVCWVATLGVFANYLAHPTWANMALHLVSVLPFFVAWPLARTSDYCDKLMSQLNTKRVRNLADNDLGVQLHVNQHLTALETALAKQNNGKGLGFVAFGMVLNKRTLSQMSVIVSSAVSTVLPVIMLLQPRATSSATEDCSLDTAQAASLQLVGQLLRATTFANSTCQYNITLDEILTMEPVEP
jgi:hypothetical protein